MAKKPIPDGWCSAKHGLIVPVQYIYVDLLETPMSRVVVQGFKPDKVKKKEKHVKH